MHHTTWRLTVNRVFAASGVTPGVGIAGHVESLRFRGRPRRRSVERSGRSWTRCIFRQLIAAEQNTRGHLKAQSTKAQSTRFESPRLSQFLGTFGCAMSLPTNVSCVSGQATSGMEGLPVMRLAPCRWWMSTPTSLIRAAAKMPCVGRPAEHIHAVAIVLARPFVH